MEFRGPPYSVWDHEKPSPAQRIHDALEGWHSSVLHAGDTLTLLAKHPDYERIAQILDKAERRLP